MSEIHYNHGPKLIRLIRAREWDQTIELLQHPENFPQTEEVDGEEWTALHYACYMPNTPIDVITKLLQIFPSAVLFKNVHGECPLHLTWHSEETVKIMLRDNPSSASIQDKWGFTPLHVACHKDRSLGIWEALLDADPSQVHVRNQAGYTPLELFFRCQNEKVRLEFIKMGSESGNIMTDVGRVTSKLLILYKKLHALLDAAWRSSSEDFLFYALHSTLKTPGCPWSFCHLALMMNPEQALCKDGDGNFPIHIAAKENTFLDGEWHQCTYCRCSLVNGLRYHGKYDEEEVLCQSCMETVNADDEENLGYYFVLGSADTISFVMKDLLSIHPEMTKIPDINGTFPLNIALTHKKFDIGHTSSLWKGAPEILYTRDLSTHMYPFMIAATAEEEGKEEYDLQYDALQQFNTVFHLIMECPNLLCLH